jgi:beta-carotene hydroxylase
MSETTLDSGPVSGLVVGEHLPQGNAGHGACAGAKRGTSSADRALEKERQQAIRELQSGVAWPTAGYALACILVFATVSTLAIMEVIPLWLGCYFNILIMMRSFAPLHEAVHGNIAGGMSQFMLLNNALGHCLGAIILLEFRALRHVHALHHRHANDSSGDPDFWMAGKSVSRAMIRCFLIIPNYGWWFLRLIASQTRTPTKALANLFSYVCVYGAVVAALMYGPTIEVLSLWVGPAFLVTSVSAFTHWTLHTPHDSREPFHNAKIVLGAGWRGYLVSHYYNYMNYHLIHHLYPRIPFYRHRAAFRLLRPVLVRKNATIIEY